MMLDHNIRLLIFDWDGTLCDSISRIAHCIHLAAEDAGIEPPSPQASREIVGLGLAEAMRALFPGVEEKQINQLRDNYSHHFMSKDHDPSPFFPGVQETLDKLKAAGYLLAVATGKSRRGLNRVLATLGLQDYFHASRCADETASKPHPRMLEELLSELGLPPEQAVMVGDTEFDMEMAHRARVHRLAVSYGAHDAGRLLKYEPLRCLDQFSEIEEMFLKQNNKVII